MSNSLLITLAKLRMHMRHFALKNSHGVNVAVCRTNGNGKCGLHAVLGVPSARELKVNDERALLLILFSEIYGNVRTRLLQEDLLTGSEAVQALDDVWSKIWTEFINPLMEQDIKGIRPKPDTERRLYGAELAKDNELH